MNPNQKSKQNELARFAKDGLRDRVSISRHILEVDEKGSWSLTNLTFTDWLTALSAQLAYQPLENLKLTSNNLALRCRISEESKVALQI